MSAVRNRFKVFFLLYLALLLAALVWVQSPSVRQRMAPWQVTAFYALIGASACYLGARALLTLRRPEPKQHADRWVWADLGIITGAVYLTGGINSEAALAYFWPLITASVERLSRRTIAVAAAIAALYVVATWSTRTDEKYVSALVFRIIVLGVVGAVATSWAKTEEALIEEVARLRAEESRLHEEVALADFRKALSRDMHDGIQGYLVATTVRLELARRLAATQPAEAARLACDQRFLLRQAASELRYLVWLLRSPEAEQENFVDALRRRLELLAEGSAVSAPLEVEGEPRPLPPEVAKAALRIAQEAIVNAQKHAAASEVRVTLRFAPEQFACTVQDNGAGFEPSSAPERPSLHGGFGLSSMRQRAGEVGGLLEITSAPGEGTAVTFAVPAQAAAREA